VLTTRALAQRRHSRNDLAMTMLVARDSGDVLLERDAPLGVFAAAVDDARRGLGGVLLLSGEAGIGKSALVRRGTELVVRDIRVLVGACEPLSTPRPLGPVRDLAVAGGRLDDLVEMGGSPSEVFDALREELAGEPTVVVIEDLHWADEATLDVVRLLARRVSTMPVVLVVTMRSDLGRLHPVTSLLGDLATTLRVTRVDLPLLSVEGVAAMAIGHDIDVELLFQRTGGNPFFVAQVLAAASDDIPQTVRDAVSSRISTLPAAARDLLDVIALAPPTAEPWLLDGMQQGSGDLLDGCVASGLVVVDRRGASFRHELMRLTVDEGMNPARRVDVHRRILAVLTQRPDLAPDPARVAHHAEGACDARAVLRFAPIAARAASRMGAFREAAAQYERALRFAAERPHAERLDLLEGRSRACYLADDQVEAIVVARQAIALAREAGDQLPEARAQLELAGYLGCRGFNADAFAALDRARELVGHHPDGCETGRALELAARWGVPLDDLDDRLLAARRSHELATASGDEFGAGHAMVTIGALTMRRDVDAGVTLLRNVVSWADERGLDEVAARALNSLGISLIHAGRLDDAAMWLDRAIDYCTDRTSDLWRINALAVAARVALDRGRWDDATRHAAAVMDDPRESPWPHHEALLVLALVRARRGDPGADEALSAAAAVGVSAEETFAHVDLALARAEVAWCERRLDEVERVTAAALVDFAAMPDAVERLTFWRSLATGQGSLCCDPRRPYEAALSVLGGDDEAALRAALAEFQRLGALPASKVAAQRLRSLGVRGVERGPRRVTKEHPAGFTTREVEVLVLLVEGLRTVDIADRLVISPRTVDHHVAAIIRKLQVTSRREAVARAVQLGIVTA
jgi:DNA-binding CsgD family transcriptional regulator/tetratricopeptide (TPR) repeat protein